MARTKREAAGAGIELDTLFRRQSKARVVAERLLTGRPQSRADLVEGLDLSLTTVPRVVEALQQVGVEIERTTDRSRQAVYKVVGTPATRDVVDPEHGPVVARFSHTGGSEVLVTITKVEVVDGRVWVEFETSDTRWRARLSDSGDGALNIPTSLLSGSARIVGVEMFSDGATGWRVGDDRASVLLSGMEKIRKN